MFFGKMHQGMNGITWLRQMEFNVGGFDFIMIIDGRADHVVSIEFV